MDSCITCISCLPIGEGDHICIEYTPPLLVLDEYEPTEFYCTCQKNKEIE